MDENKERPTEGEENINEEKQGKPQKKLRAKEWVAIVCLGVAVACVIALAVLVAVS